MKRQLIAFSLCAAIGITATVIGGVHAAQSTDRSQTHIPVDPKPVAKTVLLQGIVQSVDKTSLTLMLQPERPYCAPRTMCAQYVLAGKLWHVATTHAIIQTASGALSTELPKPGQLWIVLGTTPPLPFSATDPGSTLTATIMERELTTSMPIGSSSKH